MENCEFCFEFSGPESNKPTFFQRLFPHLHDRILLETKNFVVVPSLGQIVEGYLLVITKSHFSCMGEIPSFVYSELDWVIQHSSEILQTVYNVDCIQFEHGPSSPFQGGGCCIDHAHLHIVPLNVDIDLHLAERERYEASDYPAAVKAFLIQRKPYLYIRFPPTSGYGSVVVDSNDLPSQYMRRVIAKGIGKEDKWDWNIFLGEKEVENCLAKLMPLFVQLREYSEKEVDIVIC